MFYSGSFHRICTKIFSFCASGKGVICTQLGPDDQRRQTAANLRRPRNNREGQETDRLCICSLPREKRC